jgi:hypothetical protein
MQISLDYSSTWLAVFAILFVVLLGIQLALILRKKTLSNTRKGTRLGLNIFFFISLLLLLLQPYLYRGYEPETLILHATDVPRDFIEQLRDSLGVERSMPIDRYDGQYDEIYLVGQNFDPLQLARLQKATVNRIPYYKENELTAIDWKGLIRMGETQTVRGVIHTEEEALISLYYGDELVDSILVTPPQNTFRFTIRAKAIGRNNFTLARNSEPLGAIKFYAIENQPINYLMRFSYPDMETRRLSEWLGSRGEGIKTNIQYSTGIQQRATTLSPQDTAQFFITEPQFANSAEIKAAMASGASILFTNLGAPDRELLQINRALGTNFSVNRATQEGIRIMESTLTALPYTFISQANQWELLDNAVAYQKVGQNKIGVSLLESTFPLALQGDSVAYAAVWEEILSAMRPTNEGVYFQINQPIFKDLITDEWKINTPIDVSDLLQIGEDSVYLTRSAVNPHTYAGKWKAGKEGWISFADSLEMYIYGQEKEFSTVQQNRLISNFLQYRKEILAQTQPHQYKVEISDWWWFALVIFAAAMLWVEPRIQ